MSKTEKKEVSKKKSCFFITPIGDANSQQRRLTDGIMKSVLEPTLSSYGYSLTASHNLQNPGSITNQIIEKLLNDELVIANLTDLNPNVMYELAVRHAANLPVIVIVKNGTELPFDIRDERAIFFNNDIAGVEYLKEYLKNAIDSLTEKSSLDNPIYRATALKSIMDNSESDDPLPIILNRLVEIEESLFRGQNTKTKNSNNRSKSISLSLVIPISKKNNMAVNKLNRKFDFEWYIRNEDSNNIKINMGINSTLYPLIVDFADNNFSEFHTYILD